jgi:DNA-binding transcriptional MerR regulator
MSNQGVMRIGEVHAQLRQDFPDIELSKIRYYEDKGLVQPSRSRKGYRLYSERDVDCLREAIRLAQEEFVPLRVVRLRLIEQGLLKDLPVPSSPRHAAREATANVVSIPAPVANAEPTMRPALKVVAPSDDDGTTIDQRYFSQTEYESLVDLDATVIGHLHSLGLLAPVLIDRQVSFTALDVRVGAVASSLMERGVDIRLLGSLRRVAEREIALVDDLTHPLRAQGSGVSAERARAVSAEVAEEVAALRAVLYERALTDYLQR